MHCISLRGQRLKIQEIEGIQGILSKQKIRTGKLANCIAKTKLFGNYGELDTSQLKERLQFPEN